MDIETRYELHAKGRVRQGKEPTPKDEWMAAQQNVQDAMGVATQTPQSANDPQPGPNDHDNDPLDAADAAVIENVAAVAVAEPEPEEEPERMVFWHASRYHVEIMQAGQKVVINNSIVTIPHRQIEFTENHWVADMLEPQDREKAEWLMQCSEYRRGNILRVDEIIHKPRVEVRTGPRTTGHNTKQQPNPRPAGELSAPLH